MNFSSVKFIENLNRVEMKQGMAEEEQPGIKVTDRRMFTETGEVREGFDPGDESPAEAPARATEPVTPRRQETPQPAVEARVAEPSVGASPTEPPPTPSTTEPRERPAGYTESAREPQFLDLVAMLAEPAALFLGDATMPGQEPMEDLERARMHIDLLGLLETKCQGNLTEQEFAILSDLVYRLRLRYVEKKG